jgi:hypothetical protein
VLRDDGESRESQPRIRSMGKEEGVRSGVEDVLNLRMEEGSKLTRTEFRQATGRQRSRECTMCEEGDVE